ncbi:MAG: hypothetical protein JSR85_04980 [Proteobacteria bacterium]|nr:hypothetical protein [Pseudomonadota bacterium]
MKFRIATLLSFLSGIALHSTPAISMKNDEPESGRKSPSLKVKAPTTREKTSLKEFLSQKDYAGAFTATKAGLPHVSDEEIVNFLMTSNKYPGWDTVDPNDKAWVVAKITNAARRKDLVGFLSQKDYAGAFTATKAGLPHVSDEEIVNFLMTSNKYPGWDTVNPSDKAWVVTKVTKAAMRKDLVSFLSKQDYAGAFTATKAGLPYVSDAEIVNFLMTSNKYPGWDTVNPSDKAWVVSKITGKPYEPVTTASPPAPPPSGGTALKGPPPPPPPPAPDVSATAQRGNLLAGIAGGAGRLRKAATPDPEAQGRTPTATPPAATAKGPSVGGFAEQAVAARTKLKSRTAAPPPSSPSDATTSEPKRLVTLKSRGSADPARSPSAATATPDEPQRMVTLKKRGDSSPPKNADPDQ